MAQYSANRDQMIAMAVDHISEIDIGALQGIALALAFDRDRVAESIKESDQVMDFFINLAKVGFVEVMLSAGNKIADGHEIPKAWVGE